MRILRSKIQEKDYWHNMKRDFDHHCLSDLPRAIMPWELSDDVHNVINMFQVTERRYLRFEKPLLSQSEQSSVGQRSLKVDTPGNYPNQRFAP